MIRARIIISGFVQGVGFRYFIESLANELSLSGWVRNAPDGNVEAVFEGREENIEKAIVACKEGPPFAKVEDVIVKKSKARGDLKGFTIKYY